MVETILKAIIPNFPEQLSKQADLYLDESNLFCRQVLDRFMLAKSSVNQAVMLGSIYA